MKKWMKICLIVLCVVLVFEVLAWVSGLRVNPSEIESVKICTCVEHPYEDHVEYSVDYLELSEDEIWELAILYNLTPFSIRKLYADPAPDSDGVEIRLKSGERMWIRPYRNGQLHMKMSYLVVFNLLLDHYIQELLEEHDLPVW